MVVSGHAAATLAGIGILQRGGNLVDAMVGASAALAVVVGQATSIGGDCFLLYHEAASGRSYGLNASGVAPALASARAVSRRHEDARAARPGGARAGARLGRHASPASAACRGRACLIGRSSSRMAMWSRRCWPSACPRTARRSRPIPAAPRSICRRDARSRSARCCASRRSRPRLPPSRRRAPTSSIWAISRAASQPIKSSAAA